MNSPYKGLMPYSESDAPFFFGRAAEQDIIIANMNVSRLTLLYGASGVGKSSILRAGIAHQLRQEAQRNAQERGTPEFGVVVFSSWRDDPVASLIARVNDEVNHTLSNGHPVTLSPSHSANLTDSLSTNAQRVGGDLYIILDQFEEYFLYHPDDGGAGSSAGKHSFADEFARVLNREDLRVNFLLAIREDALAKLDRFKGRIPNLFDNYLRMAHLDRDAAREAIVKPLDEYNRLYANGSRVEIEPALVDAVLEQTRTGQVIVGESGRGAVERDAGDEIETPYLQLVMTRLWDETMRAESHTLRLETLERLGGAEKIVRTHLDTTMNALTPQEQVVSANIFNFLVTPSGTKIAHTARDLADYSHVPQNEIAITLEKLSGGDIRILRPVAPPLDQPNEPRYEIFHDVLGAPILDWRARFVQQQEKIEGEKKLAAEKRRVRRLRFGLIGVSLLLLAVIALALFALTQREAAARASAEAEQQKAEALNQRDAAQKAQADALAQKALADQEKQNAEAAKQNAIAQQKIARAGELAALSLGQLASDPERALLMAREAMNTAQTAQTEDALRTALLDPYRFTFAGKSGSSYMTDARITSDGKYAVTLEPCSDSTFSACGSVRIWNMQNGALVTDIPIQTDANKMDVSADGKYIVTAHTDHIARVWEIPSGKLVSELRGHDKKINDVHFSPDGKLVVTASEDASARVWDAQTGKLTHEFGDQELQVTAAKFSPDSTRIATVSDGGCIGTAERGFGYLRVWNTRDWTLITEIKCGADSLEFSPDSQFVTIRSNGLSPSIYSISTGNKIAEIKDAPREVHSLAFSPDGKFILIAIADGTMRIYNALSEEPPLASLLAHSAAVNSARFSPDGKLIASAGKDNRVRLWTVTDTEVGFAGASVQALQDLNGHTNQVNSVAFSPDGQSILTASDDGTARLWHVNAGIALEGHKDFVTATAYSPDGKQIATASKDGVARIWDAQTHQMLYELRGHSGAIQSIAYSPDGSKIITGSDDKTARVWDTATGQIIFTLGDAENAITAPAFSPDGKYIAAGSTRNTAGALDNRVVIWGAQDKNVAMEADSACKNPIREVRWSPDGKTMIAACDNSNLTRIHRETGSVDVLNAPNPLTQLWNPIFSPDGKRVAAVSSSNEVLVWDLTTSPPSRIALDGYFQGIGALQYSPDGKYLLTTGGEKIPRLWDAGTGKFVREFQGHAETVSRARFSPDGRLILTASNDKTARVWETATGKLIETLYGHSDILTDVSFSPDGKFILTAGDNTARIYECIACASPEDLMQLANARLTRELTCQERVTFLHETIECP